MRKLLVAKQMGLGYLCLLLLLFVLCSFCQKLGHELDGLIEDISHYIQPLQATPPVTSTFPSYRSKVSSFFPIFCFSTMGARPY